MQPKPVLGVLQLEQTEYQSFIHLFNLLVYFDKKISNKSTREIRDDLHLTKTTQLSGKVKVKSHKNSYEGFFFRKECGI